MTAFIVKLRQQRNQKFGPSWTCQMVLLFGIVHYLVFTFWVTDLFYFSQENSYGKDYGRNFSELLSFHAFILI